LSLALVKSEVLSVLGDAYDETAWSDATLEEGLRQALLFFQPYGSTRETTFPLVDSGYEHNLSSLKAYELISIGWPWGDGYYLPNVYRSWRWISPVIIRMDDLDLNVGEEIRVEYRPLHTIQHLDGGQETTFWETERQRFVLAAAHFCLLLRARYYAHAGSESERARIPSLEGSAANLMNQFMDSSPVQPGSSHYVTWGSLGL